MIITDAKHNASRIVNESLLKAEKIESRAETIENNMKIFNNIFLSITFFYVILYKKANAKDVIFLIL